ncbi:MAG: class I SAM-dependent methyltransferase [Terriglobales bacterium]
MLLTRDALELMYQNYPSPKNAVDIFKGAWFSRLPEVSGIALEAGTHGLFDDEKVLWADEQAGGFKGLNVLELGPLEGGHSYLLSRLGAARILSVEANARLFLKCLITKELYKLDRCSFLLGNFLKFMAETPERFDFCLASGVLYHMANPPELISLVAKVSNNAMFWTHYYDRDLIQRRMPYLQRQRFRTAASATYEGFTYTRHERRYGVRLRSLQFIGGTATYSCWMELEDIVAALKYFGFKTVKTNFHEKEHVNGPAVCFACSKQ